jgi:hypothetical protein
MLQKKSPLFRLHETQVGEHDPALLREQLSIVLSLLDLYGLFSEQLTIPANHWPSHVEAEACILSGIFDVNIVQWKHRPVAASDRIARILPRFVPI